MDYSSMLTRLKDKKSLLKKLKTAELSAILMIQKHNARQKAQSFMTRMLQNTSYEFYQVKFNVKIQSVKDQQFSSKHNRYF